jgi:hypothetical protein
MRITRVVAGSTAVITAVLGLILATAAPAAAAPVDSGTWRPYGNTNPITSSDSTWHCAGTRTVASNVYAQVCAIRSPDHRSVQGAVIVRNHRSSYFSARALVDLAVDGVELGVWVCSTSGVGPHSWSVCFGRTRTEPRPVDSLGSVNDTFLGLSPEV